MFNLNALTLTSFKQCASSQIDRTLISRYLCTILSHLKMFSKFWFIFCCILPKYIIESSTKNSILHPLTTCIISFIIHITRTTKDPCPDEHHAGHSRILKLPLRFRANKLKVNPVKSKVLTTIRRRAVNAERHTTNL